MKNKILTISIIFILISFILINSSFAYTETINYNNKDYEFFVPDINYNKIITMEEFTSGNYNYLIMCENSCVHIYYIDKSYDFKVRIDTGTIGYTTCLIYSNISDFSSGIIEYYMTENQEEIKLGGTNITSLKYNFYSKGNKLYMLTNLDVYSDENYTDFFFKAPVVEQEITLATVLEMNNPMEIFKTQMKNVVVSLVVFLVGLIAFLKAWAWLKTQLRKA